MRNAQETLDLINFLEYYLPVISSRIPTDINSGGCGFFAKSLHKKLKEMGYDCKMIYLADNEDKEEIENLVKNNKLNGRHGVKHCMVALNDYINFDSDGIGKPLSVVAKVKSDEYSVGEMTDEALDVLLAADVWNDVFDRDCVKDIEDEISKLDTCFDKFLKEGIFELPKLSTKYTKKTVEAKRKIQSMNGFMQMISNMQR